MYGFQDYRHFDHLNIKNKSKHAQCVAYRGDLCKLIGKLIKMR